MPRTSSVQSQAAQAFSDSQQTENQHKRRRNGDDIWDDLLETPESEAFLTMMIADVRKEEAEGKLIAGGWDAI